MVSTVDYGGSVRRSGAVVLHDCDWDVVVSTCGRKTCFFFRLFMVRMREGGD